MFVHVLFVQSPSALLQFDCTRGFAEYVCSALIIMELWLIEVKGEIEVLLRDIKVLLRKV